VIRSYFSLVKFSHTVFALPFAVIGFFLGVRATNQYPDWILLLKIILCMVFARTAAMAYNRYADRKIDAVNERTRSREIPSGKISTSTALGLVILSSILFVVTAYFINSICFYLSPVALSVVLGYSLTKRFTALCHFILGLGLSLAPIGAYLAVTGRFDMLPIHFSAAVLAWVSGFDIIYALQDEHFDREQHLHSVPARLGGKKALFYSRLLHLFSAGILIDAGIDAHFGIIYWIGVAVFCALIIYQHTLVRWNDLSKVNIAFFTTNGIASIAFACFAVTELIK
jgi:4-hydroxybenzoate polyprenyltransferase